MPKIEINGIHSIYASPSSTILESMEQAGLSPEYNCRDGHCGACRCNLLEGDVDYIGFAMAYTHGSEILPCVSKARTDIVLDRVNYSKKAQRA